LQVDALSGVLRRLETPIGQLKGGDLKKDKQSIKKVMMVPALALLLVIGIAGCGGGGGGGGGPSGTTPQVRNSEWDAMVWDQGDWQ